MIREVCTMDFIHMLQLVYDSAQFVREVTGLSSGQPSCA